MKKRNLSGIYFRAKVNDKWDNVCFEDLSPEDRQKQMEGRSEEWLKSLAEKLADTLVQISDQFGIVAE